MAPGESIPTKISRWQMCWCPARHAGHVPAPLQRHHRDGVADLPGVDPGSDLGDASGHLMAKNCRHGHALIHVPMEDVKVGSADAGVCHVDADLPRPGGLGVRRGDVDGVATDVAGGPGLGRHDFP